MKVKIKAAEQKYDLENAGLIRGPYISLIFDSVRLLIDTGKEINELKKELGKQVNHSHNRRV